METALRKATRLDYNPPKQKHLSALISMTFHHPGMVTDMMDILSKRLRENSWIISFKVLIIIHSLMRDGNGDRAIAYAEAHPSSLDTSRLREKSSGLVHIENIHNYTSYLIQRVHAYRELKMDYIKATTVNKVSRLRRLTVAQGLLRDLPVLQKQIGALLRCKFHMDDVDNTISLYAFRLLVEDMLVLFQTVNEGVVNILEQYFTMSQTDARAALEIYKRFSRQTEDTIAFMATARHLQHEMHMTIPVPKHAPLSLATALEEYLLELGDKKPVVSSAAPPTPEPQKNTVMPASSAAPSQQQQQQQQQQQPKELIDFFSSLENEKATVSFQPDPQPTGSMHNPFRMTMVPTVSTNTLQSPMHPGAMFSTPTTAPSLSASTSFGSLPVPTAVTPQQSLSTPLAGNTMYASVASPSSSTAPPPSHHYSTTNNSFNPFVTQPAATNTYNPFTQPANMNAVQVPFVQPQQPQLLMTPATGWTPSSSIF